MRSNFNPQKFTQRGPIQTNNHNGVLLKFFVGQSRRAFRRGNMSSQLLSADVGSMSYVWIGGHRSSQKPSAGFMDLVTQQTCISYALLFIHHLICPGATILLQWLEVILIYNALTSYKFNASMVLFDYGGTWTPYVHKWRSGWRHTNESGASHESLICDDFLTSIIWSTLEAWGHLALIARWFTIAF